MNNRREKWLVGFGEPDADILDDGLDEILDSALKRFDFGKRVLAIVPDQTRDDITSVVFPKTESALALIGVELLDVLVAQGTHAPMSAEEKRKKIGADRLGGSKSKRCLGTVFDHKWDDPNELSEIGRIGADEVAKLSGGLIDEEVRLTVNKRLVTGGYDSILVFSSTVPHEVAGFSGGGKYFFPGVSGPELTHATHWLGALAKIENVIGKVDTPTRRLIDAAVEFIQTPVVCINTVLTRPDPNRLRCHAFYIGDIKRAFLQAAEVSRSVHVKFVERRYRRVVALLDPHYDELWVGGKASYKLGGVIDEGGELLIVAPHLQNVSITHGSLIEKYGYAPIETVQQMVASEPDLQYNLCVAAHLAHVSYAGRTDEFGNITPKYRITLASGLSEETCKRLRLGFMDYDLVDIGELSRDPDTLVVQDAGRDLYLVA